MMEWSVITHAWVPAQPKIPRAPRRYRPLCDHRAGRRVVDRVTCDPGRFEVCLRCGQQVS